MIFDIFELLTFGMAILAFTILIINSRKLKVKKQRLKFAFLFAFLFLLFNRLFTNIELLFFEDVFNILEHFSQILAAISFVYAGFLGGKK